MSSWKLNKNTSDEQTGSGGFLTRQLRPAGCGCCAGNSRRGSFQAWCLPGCNYQSSRAWRRARRPRDSCEKLPPSLQHRGRAVRRVWRSKHHSSWSMSALSVRMKLMMMMMMCSVLLLKSDAAHSSVFSKIIQTEKLNKILQNLSISPTKVTIGSVRWFIYKQFICLIGS